jgi:hypothetical protein
MSDFSFVLFCMPGIWILIKDWENEHVWENKKEKVIRPRYLSSMVRKDSNFEWEKGGGVMVHL